MKAIIHVRRTLRSLTRASFAVAFALIAFLPGRTVLAANVPRSGASDAVVSYAQQQAQANGLDPAIFVRQIAEESGFNPTAYNAGSGAAGIAQITPAGHPDVNPWDPYASIAYAAQLDASYLSQFGRYDLMLAAYNAGPAVVAVCGCVPPYAQTQTYVRDILGSGSMPATTPTGASAGPSLQGTVATAPGGAAVSQSQSVEVQRTPFRRGIRS